MSVFDVLCRGYGFHLVGQLCRPAALLSFSTGNCAHSCPHWALCDQFLRTARPQPITGMFLSGVRVPAHSTISPFPCPPVRTLVPCRLVPIGWCGRVTASVLVPNSPSSFPSPEEHSHASALAAGGVAVCPGAARRRGHACAEGRGDRKREWGGRCRLRRRSPEWPRGGAPNGCGMGRGPALTCRLAAKKVISCCPQSEPPLPKGGCRAFPLLPVWPRPQQRSALRACWR